MYSNTVYKDYLMDWLRGKLYSISRQTLQVCESYIRHQINPIIGELTLAQLNPMVHQQFVNELKDKGLANTSVKRIFSIVHSSLDTAVKMELIPKNYSSLVHKPKLRRRELQVWDVKEVQYFLKLATREPYFYMAFHLALLTGMRQGEILGLRWIDIDFENQLLFVRQTLSHDGKEFIPGAKTSSGIRSIAIDQDTADILKEHYQKIQMDKEMNPSYTDSGLVICTELGKKIPPIMLMRAWYSILDDSKLRKITFHDLRHTHASLLLRNNVHPKIVSERLGHSSIQITLDTYSHLLPNMQKDAAGELGKTISGNFNNADFP